MELAEAFQNALYILEEERVRPTPSYRYVAKEWSREMLLEECTLKPQGYTPSVAAATTLTRMRAKRPREVWENPKLFVFESVNFNLLLTIMNQLPAENRPAFVAGVAETNAGRCPDEQRLHFPLLARQDIQPRTPR
jgi:hypothetical protein